MTFLLSTSLVVAYFLEDSHSNWGKIESQCDLTYIFKGKDVKHFSCIYWSFVIILLRTVFNSFAHLLIELFVLLVFIF
jgi:hypothetical protein